jgi:hypothetical protein
VFERPIKRAWCDCETRFADFQVSKVVSDVRVVTADTLNSISTVIGIPMTFVHNIIIILNIRLYDHDHGDDGSEMYANGMANAS